MLCPRCQQDHSPHHATCPSCYEPLGFPNVRAAEDAAEVAALGARHVAARDVAIAGGFAVEFDRFEATASKSQAIVCKEWGLVLEHRSKVPELFATFHEQIRCGARRVKDDPYEQVRPAVDGLLFPHYAEKVSFGALSLDGRAPVAYGECRFHLKESFIGHRSTVFETNSLVFVRDRKIPAVGPLPSGHRATWAERGRLAAVKHAAELAPGLPDSAFPGILFQDKGSEEGFVEVHVYEKILPEALEGMTAPKPPRKDRALARELESALYRAGVRVKWE